MIKLRLLLGIDIQNYFHFRQLMQKYEVCGIPSLIVVNNEGDVISNHGRSEVTEKGPKAFQLWLQTANSKK